MRLEIPKEQWKEFFDDLSRDLEEWDAQVKMINNEVGEQVLADGLPFHGLTAETDHTGEFTITLSVGNGTEGHQTHTVATPFKVWFEKASAGPGGVLEIEDAAGSKMVITFIQPLPVVVEYVESETIAFART